MGHRSRGDQLRSGGIDVHHPDENIRVQFPEFRWCAEWVFGNRLRAKRGIIEDDVDTTEIFGGIMYGSRGAFRVADVCAEWNNGCAPTDCLNLVGDFLQFFTVQIDQRQMRALFRQCECHCPTEPAPGAREQDNFSDKFSVSHFHCLYSCYRAGRYPGGSPFRQAAARRWGSPQF
jgi:hypothetical protein